MRILFFKTPVLRHRFFLKSGGSAARKRDVSQEPRVPGGKKSAGEWTFGAAGEPAAAPTALPQPSVAPAPRGLPDPATKAAAWAAYHAAVATAKAAGTKDPPVPFHPTLGTPAASAEEMAHAVTLGVPLGPQSYGVTFPQGKKHVLEYRDLRGRRQMRYPAAQGEASRAKKFSTTLKQFRDALPGIRTATERDLLLPGTGKERAAAAIITIIDRTNMRIGGEAFAQREGDPTYGAASLRKEHVRVEGDTVLFKFPGKEHVEWERSVKSAELAAAVSDFLRTPGDRLWSATDSTVRDYLEPFGITPHIWRTNTACKIVAASLAKAGPAPNLKVAKANIKAAVEKAADALGNLPAACQKNYVDPRIIEDYLQGSVAK